MPAPPEIAMRMMRERGMPPPGPGRYNDFDGPPPPLPFDDGARGPRHEPRDRPGPDEAHSPEGPRRPGRGPVAGRLGGRVPEDEETEGGGGKEEGKERERRRGGDREEGGGRMGPYGYGYGGFGRGMPPMFPPHMGGAPDPRGMRRYACANSTPSVS